MAPCPECPGMWTCDDMEHITTEWMFELNQNNDDNVINLDDALD